MNQLLGLFLVSDSQSVKVAGGSDLELDVVSIALDGDLLSIRLVSELEETLNVGDLLL